MFLVTTVVCYLVGELCLPERWIDELEVHLHPIWGIELEVSPTTFCHLTFSDLRFLLATFGIKMARKLYQQRSNPPPTDSRLLRFPALPGDELLEKFHRYETVQSETHLKQIHRRRVYP
jgi:hypothetical protein